MSNEDSEAKISQEIIADARGKADRALKAAQREAETLTQQAHADAKQLEQGILDAARRRADSRVKIIQATVDPERRRLELNEREKVIEGVVAEAKARIMKLDEAAYGKALSALAAEAAATLGEGRLIAYLSAEDAKRFASTLPAQARAAAGAVGIDITIELRPAQERVEWGAIFETTDGMKRVDSTLDTRLRRAYPELRRKIAEIIYKK